VNSAPTPNRKSVSKTTHGKRTYELQSMFLAIVSLASYRVLGERPGLLIRQNQSHRTGPYV
jgi:hypothetical protein